MANPTPPPPPMWSPWGGPGAAAGGSPAAPWPVGGFPPVPPARRRRRHRIWPYFALVLIAALLATSFVLRQRSGPTSTPGTVPAITSPHPTASPTQAPLTAGPIAAWGGAVVKVACVTIHQEIPQVAGYTYPIGGWVGQVLAPAGIKAVSSGQACDAEVRVSLHMEGISAPYRDSDGKVVTLYDGMKRRFELSLVAPGRTAIVGYTDTTDTAPASMAYANGPRTPREFLDHWASTMQTFAVKGVVKLWGAPVGIEALKVGELATMADQALRDLTGMGRPGTVAAPEGYDGWRDWYERTRSGS